MIKRKLKTNIANSLKHNKSILLLGPRQVGKSTLMESLTPDIEFNLSQQSLFVDMARDPSYLENHLNAKLPKGGTVLIDEVQRIPSLLNTVQYLIDKKKGFQFLLTGSSARKLKRGKANLLPGRIHSYELGPLTADELKYNIKTEDAIQFGMLPGVITESDSKQKKLLLKTYTHVYLNEEIKAEALTKNIEGFTRFLYRLSADSTKYLDLSKISSASAVPRQTVQRYFEILEDTMIVRRVDAFAKSDKRRLIQHPKFFIFDNGVLNGLLNNFNISDDRKGQLFENLFITQLIFTLSNTTADYRISTYRTDSDAEVDVILEIENKILAIEIKSGYFSKSELGGLRSFKKYINKPIEQYVAVANNTHKIIDEIEIIPWQLLLKKIESYL